MDAMPNKITLEEFKILCFKGQMYKGDVEGLGSVDWAPKHVRVNITGLPSQTPYNTPQGSMFTENI
jgi:hypothetical protein